MACAANWVRVPHGGLNHLHRPAFFIVPPILQCREPARATAVILDPQKRSGFDIHQCALTAPDAFCLL
jgi:hypothetical protein